MHEKEHDIVVKRGDCDKFKHFFSKFTKYKPDTKEKGTIMTIFEINLCFCELAAVMLPKRRPYTEKLNK